MKIWTIAILVLVLLASIGCYQNVKAVTSGWMPDNTDVPTEIYTGSTAVTNEPPQLSKYEVKATPGTLAITKLTPDKYVGDFKIEKWEGDGYVAVPRFSLDMQPTKWNNVVTILDKNGIVAQYDTGKVRYDDVTLFEDSFYLCVTNKGIYQFDYDGNCIWGLDVDNISHQAEVLNNGESFLFVRPSFDQVVELSRDGKTLWQWNAYDGIPEYTPDNFPGKEIMDNVGDKMTSMWYGYRQIWENDGHGEWTHINSVQKLDNGNYIIGLRNLDTVIEVTPENKIVWSFGGLLIEKKHHPRKLSNGNLIIFDNGNGRVVEYQPDGKVIFEYPVYAPVFGWIEKHGDTYFFPDCFNGKALQVDLQGNIIKSVFTYLTYQAKLYEGNINIE